MLDDGSDLSQAPEVLLQTGYTYFGQFAAHDLTKEQSSLDQAWTLAPEEIENLESPCLDLSHIYGRGPFDEAHASLYESGDVQLKVGKLAGRAGNSFDIATDSSGALLAADDRTAENVILRQITAVFARLHNAAVEQHRPQHSDAAELFRKARLQTVWQYQLLVRDDFLFWLLDRRVFDAVLRNTRSLVDWTRFSIPIEFSAAAMRFGHTMARQKYLIGHGRDKTLREIFGRDLQQRPLDPEWELDWGFFFQGASAGSAALSSRPIDTRIVRTLHDVPGHSVCLHHRQGAADRDASAADADFNKLPVRTLLRGAGLRLATGQAAAEAFHESVFTTEELTTDRNGRLTASGKVLRDAKLGTDTPLWYYILKESELRYNGNRLGPVGSRIIAETFLASLASDPDSILNHPDAPRGRIAWKIGGQELELPNLRALFAAAPTLP